MSVVISNSVTLNKPNPKNNPKELGIGLSCMTADMRGFPSKYMYVRVVARPCQKSWKKKYMLKTRQRYCLNTHTHTQMLPNINAIDQTKM